MRCECKAQLYTICTLLVSKSPPISGQCKIQAGPQCKGPAAPGGCGRNSTLGLMPCVGGGPTHTRVHSRVQAAHSQAASIQLGGCGQPSQFKTSCASLQTAHKPTFQAGLTSLSLMMRFSSSSTVLVTNTSFRIMVSFLYCELLAYRSCSQAAHVSEMHEPLLGFCWQQRGSSCDTHLAVAAKLHLQELVAKLALVPTQCGAPHCQQRSGRHQQQQQSNIEKAAHPT